jgi:hypothetical protein
MAWGGLIFATPLHATLDSLPNDYAMPSLGSSSDVRAVLESLFPDNRHTDGQSTARGDGYWVELNYDPNNDSVDSIGVRTNADTEALAVLELVCNRFSARLYDNQTGDFADFGGSAASSLENFRNFRDRNLPPGA